MLRVSCCMLRAVSCMLRAVCCMVRVACCVLRATDERNDVFSALWRVIARLHAKNIAHNLLIADRAQRVCDCCHTAQRAAGCCLTCTCSPELHTILWITREVLTHWRTVKSMLNCDDAQTNKQTNERSHLRADGPPDRRGLAPLSQTHRRASASGRCR